VKINEEPSDKIKRLMLLSSGNKLLPQKQYEKLLKQRDDLLLFVNVTLKDLCQEE
jgi:hypothetical protein